MKSVSVKRNTIIFASVFLALAGLGWLWHVTTKKPSQARVPTVVVNAEKAKSQRWYTQIKATGTLSSFRGILISSEVSGRVTEIAFESGTFLKKDTPLFQIYPDILDAQLEQYNAMTKLAALDYVRGLKLYEKSVISRQDLDQLTSTLQQDKALVSQTQAKLVQHNIKAPFDGQAGLRMVNEGDYVKPGQNLVSFQQLSPLRIQFAIPENYMPLLAKNQSVQIIPSSNPKLIETGTVYAFDSAIDPNTRAISMRAEIPNKDHRLIPGGFAEVTLFAGKERQVITVPQTAINYSTLGSSVYVVQADQTVKSIQITVGDRLGDEIEVTSGLDAGAMVVTGGQIKLHEGAKVAIAPLKTSSSPQSATASQSANNNTSAATASTKSNAKKQKSTKTSKHAKQPTNDQHVQPSQE